ncbi:hypothetical protein pb186bvf_005573 [Paramecium bursaria]
MRSQIRSFPSLILDFNCQNGNFLRWDQGQDQYCSHIKFTKRQIYHTIRDGRYCHYNKNMNNPWRIQLQRQLLQKKNFRKHQIQGYDAIVLNHNYLIFNLLPNDTIITSQQYKALNEEQIQELIKLCQFHNQNRTNCKNLHLKYAKEFTIMRLKGFSPKYSFFTTVNQLLLAKQFFFLRVQEDQEQQNNAIRSAVNDENSGKFAFIDQHPYI